MNKTEIDFRKKREVGEIINDSFQFLKQEYKPILGLIAIYVLPFMLLYGAGQVFLQMKLIDRIDFTDTESLMANIGPVYTNILLYSLFGLFVQSLLIATFYSYIEVYVKKGKGNFDLSEVKTLLYSNGLLALGAGITVYIIVLFGILLCIVPGIYFANTLSLTAMIFIFEKKGLGNAVMRSALMVRYNWWNTFLLNLIGIVIIWVSNMILSIPTMLTGISNNLLSGQQPSVMDYPQWYWIITGLISVISALLMIILYTFLAFQYFNLDERTKQFFPPRDNGLPKQG